MKRTTRSNSHLEIRIKSSSCFSNCVVASPSRCFLSIGAATSPTGLATRETAVESSGPDVLEKKLPARRCGCNRSENVNRGDNDPAGVVHAAKITFSVLEILGAMYIKVIRFARGRRSLFPLPIPRRQRFYLLRPPPKDTRFAYRECARVEK